MRRALVVPSVFAHTHGSRDRSSKTLGPASDGNVRIADVHTDNVDERLASSATVLELAAERRAPSSQTATNKSMACR